MKGNLDDFYIIFRFTDITCTKITKGESCDFFIIFRSIVKRRMKISTKFKHFERNVESTLPA